MSDGSGSPPPPVPPRNTSSWERYDCIRKPATSKEDIENEGDDTTDGYTEVEDESESPSKNTTQSTEDLNSFDSTSPNPATPSTSFQTEDSSRRWVLTTLWDTCLSLGIQRGLRVPGAGRDQGRMRYTRQEFVAIINSALDKMSTSDVRLMLDSDFVMVYIIPQTLDTGYSRYSQNFQAEVVQINVQNAALYPGTALKRHHVSRELVTSIFATGRLAEVFRSVVDISDLLIISGGYSLEPTPNGIECVLTPGGEQRTEIIRIQGSRDADLESEVSLMERIEPIFNQPERRYKFTYSARQGTVMRQVVQHRNFSEKTFCRNVTDTLAFSQVRWDFPMPVVRGTNPQSIFDILFSPKFSMPPWDNSEPQEDTESDSGENNDDTFMTANVSTVDLSPKKHLNLPPPWKKRISFEGQNSDSPPARAVPKSQTNLPPRRYQASTNPFFSKRQNPPNPPKKVSGSRKKATMEPEGDEESFCPGFSKMQLIIIMILIMVYIISMYAMWQLSLSRAAEDGNKVSKTVPGAFEEEPPSPPNQVQARQDDEFFASSNDSPYSLFFRFIRRGKGENEVEKGCGQNNDWTCLSFWVTALSKIGGEIVNLCWVVTCWLNNNFSLESILTRLGLIQKDNYYYL